MERSKTPQQPGEDTEGLCRCLVYDIGRKSYKDALDLQIETHSRCKSREIPTALILVEHDPVITFGAKADPDNLLLPQKLLEKAGIELVQTDRGGDVTYHGPGQLVGYPIINLKEMVKDVHNYLRLLEEVVIQTLAEYGLAGRRNGPAGVWVEEKKVCSIGIAVRGWVTYHGFALNVSPTLEHFQYINPCGLRSEQISSIEQILGRKVELSEVKTRVLSNFAKLFACNLIHEQVPHRSAVEL